MATVHALPPLIENPAPAVPPLVRSLLWMARMLLDAGADPAGLAARLDEDIADAVQMAELQALAVPLP